jgi:hypothetical protein
MAGTFMSTALRVRTTRSRVSISTADSCRTGEICADFATATVAASHPRVSDAHPYRQDSSRQKGSSKSYQSQVDTSCVEKPAIFHPPSVRSSNHFPRP